MVARLREILLGSARLFADETTMPVLEPGRGKTKKGYAWAIARDDRPWGGTDPPAVVFHYAPGRGAEHVLAVAAVEADLLDRLDSVCLSSPVFYGLLRYGWGAG